MADEEIIQLALDDARDRMGKGVEALERELATIRTGRAHPALVEHLHVDYHGTSMPLNQLGTINAPEARMLVIQPWDKGAFNAITKAIQQSDIGINPQSDGVVIRLVLPELTEERRREMVKLVGGKVEGARVAIRNVRRDVQDELRKLEREKEISQDEGHRAHDQLEQITSEYIAKLDEAGSAKERELLEV